MTSWNIELGKVISMLTTVLVMLLLLFRSQKIKQENILFIIGYSLLSLIDIFCYFYYKYTKSPTDIFYIIGFLIIVFLIYLLYYFRLFYSLLLRKIQIVLIGIFVLNIFIQLIVNENALIEFSFNWLYINTLILFSSIALFLYQTFNSNKILQINNYLPFWISVAILIAFIGSIPISFLRYSVPEEIYFLILFILNSTSNLIIIRGILCHKQNY